MGKSSSRWDLSPVCPPERPLNVKVAFLWLTGGGAGQISPAHLFLYWFEAEAERGRPPSGCLADVTEEADVSTDTNSQTVAPTRLPACQKNQ